MPDRDAGRPEHRPDRLLVDVRPHQPVRLHRDAVPEGREGVATEEIEYLAADDEDRYVIAQANARVDEQGRFLDEKVLVRAAPERGRVRRPGRGRLHGRVAEADRLGGHERSSRSSSTTTPTARSMGANMQRQAVPLLRSTAPFIGTGVESRAARDAGDLVVADDNGTVAEVSGDSIVVDYQKHGRTTHRLSKFRRSNQGTCINQKPLVESGDQVRRATSWPTGRPRTTASSRWARTFSWRSCPGRATTTRTRS